MSDELEIRAAGEADMPALSRFMQAQDQHRSSADYLRHWYFSDPQAGASVIIGSKDGTIVGMATMKHHRFAGPEGVKVVAMPQKVLTDASMRGKGIFQKLYWASEADARSKGVGHFLTVTNAASTSIFLGRFGYQRLPSPGMRVLFPSPGALHGLAVDVRNMVLSDPRPRSDAWRMTKPEGHLRWRYLAHPLKECHVLHAGTGGVDQGWLFVKRVRKRGLPLLLLMDAVPSVQAHMPDLIRQARRMAWQQRTVAVLGLQSELHDQAMRDSGPSLRLSSGFNLLVKGIDAAHTGELVRHRFDLSFGDLDFF